MKTNLKSECFLKLLSLLVYFVLSISTSRAADPVPAAAVLDAAGNFSGKVVETITTAGYTYIQVENGSQKLWAATTHFATTNGDNVTVVGGMPMANFHSKSLNRDFDVIYFTGKIIINSGATHGVDTVPVLPPGHPALPGQAASPVLPPDHPPLPEQAAPVAKIDLAGIKKAAGGKTIQEILSSSSKLAGKPVTVRGKVVKYNAMILGRNWLHIQDGSGSTGKNNLDLMVTTTAVAKVGDTVLVTGNVSINKDFGAGYKYPLILDDAKVTVE